MAGFPLDELQYFSYGGYPEGPPPSDVPKSMFGKELYAGGNRYLAGFGHIGGALGIPGAEDYAKEKEERANELQSLSTAPHSWGEVKLGDAQKGLIPYLTQLASSSAPYMAEAAGYVLADIATEGALTPAILTRYATFLGPILPRFLGGQGLKTGAEYGVRKAAVAGAREAAPGLARTAMIPAVTYPSSLGDVLSNQQEESGKYNLGAAVGPAAIYAGANILGLEGALTRGTLPRLGIRGLEKNFLGRAASGALATAGSESVNETIQEFMNQAGRMGVNPAATMTDPGALERYKESAIGGAFLGGLPGSLHAFSAPHEPVNLLPTARQQPTQPTQPTQPAGTGGTTAPPPVGAPAGVPPGGPGGPAGGAGGAAAGVPPGGPAGGVGAGASGAGVGGITPNATPGVDEHGLSTDTGAAAAQAQAQADAARRQAAQDAQDRVKAAQAAAAAAAAAGTGAAGAAGAAGTGAKQAGLVAQLFSMYKAGLPKDHKKTDDQIRADLKRLVDPATTHEEAVALLETRIQNNLEGKTGGNKESRHRTAEKMHILQQSIRGLLGVPEDQQETFTDRVDRHEKAKEDAKAAAAAAKTAAAAGVAAVEPTTTTHDVIDNHGITGSLEITRDAAGNAQRAVIRYRHPGGNYSGSAVAHHDDIKGKTNAQILAGAFPEWKSVGELKEPAPVAAAKPAAKPATKPAETSAATTEAPKTTEGATPKDIRERVLDRLVAKQKSDVRSRNRKIYERVLDMAMTKKTSRQIADEVGGIGKERVRQLKMEAVAARAEVLAELQIDPNSELAQRVWNYSAEDVADHPTAGEQLDEGEKEGTLFEQGQTDTGEAGIAAAQEDAALTAGNVNARSGVQRGVGGAAEQERKTAWQRAAVFNENIAKLTPEQLSKLWREFKEKLEKKPDAELQLGVKNIEKELERRVNNKTWDGTIKETDDEEGTSGEAAEDAGAEAVAGGEGRAGAAGAETSEAKAAAKIAEANRVKKETQVRKKRTVAKPAEAAPVTEAPLTTAERSQRNWDAAAAAYPDLGTWNQQTPRVQSEFMRLDENNQKLADAVKAKEAYGPSIQRSRRAIKSDRPKVEAWAKNKFGDRVAPNGRLVWQNFMRWFGDSMIVDEDGNPQRVFHGTMNVFTTFKRFLGPKIATSLGFHFAADPEIASVFAWKEIENEGEAGNILPVYIRMQNPLSIVDSENFDDTAVARAVVAHSLTPKLLSVLFNHAGYNINVASARAIMDKWAAGARVNIGEDFLSKEGFLRNYVWSSLSPSDMKLVGEAVDHFIRTSGYDGVIYTNTSAKETERAKDKVSFIVFHPEQVKSSTGNNGNFSIKEGDIQQSTRGAAPKPTQAGSTTVWNIRKALKEWGFTTIRIFRHVRIVQAWKDLPADVRNDPRMTKEDPYTTQGFVMDGKIYLIADNIDQGQERSVFIHEVGAHLGLDIREERRFSQIVKSWQTSDTSSMEFAVAQAVDRRLRAAGQTWDNHSEVVAYAAEEALNHGVKPSMLSEVGRWLYKLLTIVRAAMADIAGRTNYDAHTISAQDLVDYTFGAAHLALSKKYSPKLYQHADLAPTEGFKARLSNLYGGVAGVEHLIKSSWDYIRRFTDPAYHVYDTLAHPLILRLKQKSDSYVQALQGDSTAPLQHNMLLGKFPSYSTWMDRDWGGDLNLYVEAPINMKDVEEPILQVTITALDGSLIILGPHSNGKTFKMLRAQGLADFATGPGGVQHGNWTALTDVKYSELLDLLAEVHARLRVETSRETVGIKWQRATGATGGAGTHRKGVAYFSKRAERPFFERVQERAQAITKLSPEYEAQVEQDLERNARPLNAYERRWEAWMNRESTPSDDEIKTLKDLANAGFIRDTPREYWHDQVGYEAYLRDRYRNSMAAEQLRAEDEADQRKAEAAVSYNVSAKAALQQLEQDGAALAKALGITTDKFWQAAATGDRSVLRGTVARAADMLAKRQRLQQQAAPVQRSVRQSQTGGIDEDKLRAALQTEAGKGPMLVGHVVDHPKVQGKGVVAIGKFGPVDNAWIEYRELKPDPSLGAASTTTYSGTLRVYDGDLIEGGEGLLHSAVENFHILVPKGWSTEVQTHKKAEISTSGVSFYATPVIQKYGHLLHNTSYENAPLDEMGGYIKFNEGQFSNADLRQALRTLRNTMIESMPEAFTNLQEVKWLRVTGVKGRNRTARTQVYSRGLFMRFSQLESAVERTATGEWAWQPQGINPKVRPLIDALNGVGIFTTMSGDMYGDEMVYADLVVGDGVRDRIAARLPAGWVTSTHKVWDTFEKLGLPLDDELKIHKQETLDGISTANPNVVRISRKGGAVSESEAHGIARALAPVAQPETYKAGDLRKEIAGFIGATNERVLHVVQSVDDPSIPRAVRRALEPKTQAATYQNQVWIFADRVHKGTGTGVFLHELGVHLGLEDHLLTAEDFKSLVAKLHEWAKREDTSMESQIAQRALRRIPANTAEHLRDGEFLAYFIEEAMKGGLQPSALDPKTPLGQWFAKLWEMFEKALKLLNIKSIKKLTAQNVLDLAYGAARLEMAGMWHGTAGTFSEFDNRFINTGEGNQSYGWGHYLAQVRDTAQAYWLADIERKNTEGALYIDGERILDAGWQSTSKKAEPFIRELFNQPEYTAADMYNTYGDIEGALWVLVRNKGDYNEAVDDAKGTISVLERRGPEYGPQLATAKKILTRLESLKDRNIEFRRAGNIMRVDINVQPHEMLDWDAKWADQSPLVRAALEKLPDALYHYDSLRADKTGANLYMALVQAMGGDKKKASEKLASLGIKGVRYFDEISRSYGKNSTIAKTRNLVVFDAANIKRVTSEPGGVARAIVDREDEIRQSQTANAAFNALPQPLRKPVRSIWTSIKTAAKNGMLAGAITEDLSDITAADMPSVADYIEIQKSRNAEKVGNEQKIEEVLKLYDTLPQNERGISKGSVNDFIHDSTIENKWGYKPAGLPTAVVDAEMEKRFNKLSKEGQKLVRAMFQHGEDMLAAKKQVVVDAINADFAERALGVTDVRQLARLQRQRDAQLAHFDNLLRIKGTGPYAPLKRFGKYVAVAKSQAYLDAEGNKDQAEMNKLIAAGDHYHVEFADTQAEADDIADELRPHYAEAESFAKESPDAYLYANHDMFLAFAKMRRMLEEQFGDTKAATDTYKHMDKMLRDMYLSTLAESSARKSELRRRGVAGASRDMMRAFATQGRADAHFLASVKYNDQILNALQAMRNEAKTNRRTNMPYLNEMLLRHGASLEYRPHRVEDVIRRATSVWMLATSPAFYLQQLTQTYMMSLPVIAGTHGYFRTEQHLRRAYSDLASLVTSTNLTDHIDWSKAPADVRDMLQTLTRNGKIDIGIDVETGSWATQGSGVASKWWNKADRILRGVNVRVESLNRATAAIAAYRMALAKSTASTMAGRIAEATKYAEAMVHQTHGSYDGFNTPRLLSSAFPGARTITQFRRFQIIQLSLIARLTYNALKGESPKVRAIARRSLFYTLGHTAVMGGLMGMPGAAAIMWILNKLFHDPDDPEDLELEIRRSIGDQTLADMVLNGAPAAAGVNLSGKLGMGQVLSLLPFTDISFSRKGYADMVMGSLGPFVGGLMPRAMDGIDLIGKGDYYKGLEQLLPNGLGNAMKGMRFATDGVTMRNGDVVIPADQLTMFDATMQGLGLPTTTITHRTAAQQDKYEFETFYHDREAQLKNDYIAAYKANDAAAMADVRKDWTALQESRVKNGFKRQPLSNLLRAPAEQRKRERHVEGGLEWSKSNRHFVEERSRI